MKGGAHTARSPAVRGPRRFWPAAAALLVVVVAAGWWLLRPDALTLGSLLVGFEVNDERPRLAGDVVINDRPVELISVRPVAPPPEGTRVTPVACRLHDPRTPLGTADGPISDHCAETREVEGLRLDPHGSVEGREWDVIVVIELGDQPSYVTERFVVEYRDGVRWGRQTTGVEVYAHRPGHDPFE